MDQFDQDNAWRRKHFVESWVEWENRQGTHLILRSQPRSLPQISAPLHFVGSRLEAPLTARPRLRTTQPGSSPRNSVGHRPFWLTASLGISTSRTRSGYFKSHPTRPVTGFLDPPPGSLTSVKRPKVLCSGQSITQDVARSPPHSR